MAIQLRSNEKIVFETRFHWVNYVGPTLWAVVIAGIGVLGSISEGSITTFSASLLAIGLWPLAFVWLSNKTKAFIITNQRVYVEIGILAKLRKDIPLAKVNDIEVGQGLIGRLVGSGHIKVLTGNDKPTILKGIERPDAFKDAIGSVLSKSQAA